MSRDKIIGAVLLGGQSQRMGEPKHLVQLADGNTMLERVNNAMQPLCSQIVLLGNPESNVPEKFRLLEDRRTAAGPLAGIEALLLCGLASRYLVAACDQPLLSTALLKRLLDTSAPICIFASAKTNHYYPFPGLYTTSFLTEIQQALDDDQRAVQGILRTAATQKIPVDAETETLLQSINTRKDLAHLL
jgi:molybdopterin-guanine dinucleotide biosynthesis protein A